MTPDDRKVQRRAARRAARDAPVQVAQLTAPANVPNQAAVFHNIQVVPGDAYRLRSVLTNGGPVWPDFEEQTLVRFMRRGRFVDEPVEPSQASLAVIDRPCVWAGYAIGHFGHLIADHMTRVLEGRVNRPDDLFLFLLPPRGVPANVKDFVWQVMDWYGLARSQVHFVQTPILVYELRCFAQAEPFGSAPPTDHYLSLLTANARERGLRPGPDRIVYVGRMGLLAAGKGGAAGETWLVGQLAQSGVMVLDPAKASLRDQLSAYAGARVLIFAEGSAVHGRQLLGRLDQTIVVLNRRQGARIAEVALAARCTELIHVEACRQVVQMGTMAVRNQRAVGLALYDLTAVFAAFAGFGVDLRRGWDQVAYDAAVLADAGNWVAAHAGSMGATGFDLDQACKALQDADVAVSRPDT